MANGYSSSQKNMTVEQESDHQNNEIKVMLDTTNKRKLALSHSASSVLHSFSSNNKPGTRWDIFDSIDNEATEAIAASKIMNTFRPLSLFKKNSGHKYAGYSELRTQYLQERRQERNPDKNENTLSKFIKYRSKQLKDFFSGNEWIFNIIFCALDLTFCILYLSEIQINVNMPCKSGVDPTSPNSCGNTNLPAPLLVYRGPYAFHILVFLSGIRLGFLSLYGLVFADSALAYFTVNPSNIVTLCITVPFLAVAQIKDSKYFYIPYFLAIFPFIHNLKGWLFHKRSWAPLRLTEFHEKVIMLITYIFSLIYVGVALFNWSETRFVFDQNGSDSNESISLLRTFYFMVITMTTVGYGDITPNTAPGQIAIVFLIMFALAVLPYLINDLFETIKEQASGNGSYHRGKNPFVVVCGDTSDSFRILDFIETILRRDVRGEKMTHIVLLSRERCPPDLKYALKQNQIKDRVFFLRGSGLDTTDLLRVHLDYAACAFILTKFRVEDDHGEDDGNTLRSWAFRKYSPCSQIYLETRLPQTQYLQENVTTGTICASELKQIFMAYNCLYRGFSTVLFNLLRDIKAKEAYDEPWETQYGDGASNEIFRAPISPLFIGQTFSDVAIYCYRHFQVILIAIDSYLIDSDTYHTALNPGTSYCIQPNDYGFFIAPSQGIIKEMSQLSKADYERSRNAISKSFKQIALSVPIPSMNRQRPSLDPKKYHRRFDFIIGSPSVSPDEKAPLCVLSATPVTMEDSIIEEANLLSEHFLILTGTFNLFRFVCTLRSAHLAPHEITPILILSSRAPNEAEFAQFSQFPQVYFMVGNIKKAAVLRQAGLFKCSRVVLMNLASLKPLRADANPHLQDSSTIMVTNLIEKLFRENGIPNSPVCELLMRQNIHFLGCTSTQQLVRKKKKDIPEKEGYENVNFIDNGYFAPFYAAGSVLCPVMIESLISNSYHIPGIIKLFNCIAGVQYASELGVNAALKMEVSSLRYVVCPTEFVGKTFGSLFQAFSQMGIVPIGLLRDNIGSDTKNPLPFVYTNPPWCLLMKESDYIYILAPASVLSP